MLELRKQVKFKRAFNQTRSTGNLLHLNSELQAKVDKRHNFVPILSQKTVNKKRMSTGNNDILE